MTTTIPPIGAPVVHSGAIGRIEHLEPKHAPRRARVVFGRRKSMLALAGMTYIDGKWHYRYRPGPKPIEHEEMGPPKAEKDADLLIEHYERLATFGFTRESFKRLCEANDLSLREG